MFYLSNLVRSKGDPKVVRSGPGSLTSVDYLVRALGWFSIGLGAIELLAPARLTRPLGMRGKEDLVRAYGAREIASGVVSLSVEKQAGLYSRIAGDGLDFATLLAETRTNNRRKGNVTLALLMIGGIACLDYFAARGLRQQHDPSRGSRRIYSERSGFPKGLEAAKQFALRIGKP